MKFNLLLVLLGVQLVSLQALAVQPAGLVSHSNSQKSLSQRWRSSVSAIHHYLASNSELNQFLSEMESLDLGGGKSNHSCNMTDMGMQFVKSMDLVSDFVSNSSQYLEMIVAKVVVCTNAPFPQSLSCLLALPNDCQKYVDAIKGIASNFCPKIIPVLYAWYKDVAKCCNWWRGIQ